MADLTPKQEAWLTHYLGDANYNATEAARLAGYSGSYAVLGVAGHDNLKNPKIQAALRKVMEERGISVPELIDRYTAIARASLDDFIEIDESGAWWLKLNKAKRRGKLYTLESIRNGKEGIEIKMRDAIAALDRLAKIHGLIQGGQPSLTLNQVNVNLSPDERRQRLAELLEDARQIRDAEIVEHDAADE